jgi:glycosyltransferase involved in cell wall biosynthesis
MSISVCIATYNGEAYIKEQLDSILSQLLFDYDIFVSDDCSSDATVTIIESIDYVRIRLFTNQTFASHVYNFEHALKHATKEYIFLSDQDDVWLPHKRETMLKYLTSYDVVLSDAFVVDEALHPLYPSFFAFNHSKKGFFKNLYKNSYLGCCMAFNRKILDKSLPFPRDINMHDWWIGMITEVYGSVYLSDECLIQYRRHEKTITPINRQSNNSFFTKIGFRVIMLKGLISRYFSLKGKQ